MGSIGRRLLSPWTRQGLEVVGADEGAVQVEEDSGSELAGHAGVSLLGSRLPVRHRWSFVRPVRLCWCRGGGEVLRRPISVVCVLFVVCRRVEEGFAHVVLVANLPRAGRRGEPRSRGSFCSGREGVSGASCGRGSRRRAVVGEGCLDETERPGAEHDLVGLVRFGYQQTADEVVDGDVLVDLIGWRRGCRRTGGPGWERPTFPSRRCSGPWGRPSSSQSQLGGRPAHRAVDDAGRTSRSSLSSPT